MASDIVERLKELSKQANELRTLVVPAFADRDEARPLITEREGLKNRISETVSRIQPDSSRRRLDTPEVAEYRKQYVELNAKVGTLYARLTSLGESCKDLVYRVESTLQLVPHRARRLCKEIETLPLLRRGFGPNCSDACGDLEALSFRLDELVAHLDAAESKGSKDALSPVPVINEQDPKANSQLRHLKLESGHKWETIVMESGISRRRLFEISNGANPSPDTRARLSACFSRLLGRTVQF